MLRITRSVFLAAAAIRAVSATPLPATPNPSASTLTIPAGQIEPRFRVALTSHGDNEYDDDSGLMAMAKMLHRLSLYDFNTGMVEPQTYVAEGFPDVSVSISGRPGASKVPAKFAIWGAFLASQYLAREEIVRDFKFVLTFSNTVFGYIRLAPGDDERIGTAGAGNGDGNPPPKTQRSHPYSPSETARAFKRAAAAEAATTNKPTLIPLTADSTTVPSSNDKKIHLQYILSPTITLSKRELFANIHADFLIIGGYPSHKRIQTGWERMQTTHFLNSITGWRVRGSPPDDATYQDAADGSLTVARLVVTEKIGKALAFRLVLNDLQIIWQGYVWGRTA
ncbi:MAG: hypothetical protein LQ345_001440 [Seirophora villosa]|nr:MAG: hypothetical protein LQ345_001440 [Seirophora villosa]